MQRIFISMAGLLINNFLLLIKYKKEKCNNIGLEFTEEVNQKKYYQSVTKQEKI